MGTKKMNTEIRQGQIAQAALTLVAGRGLKGLTVADIAEQVGLVPSAIYRHFKGKEEIIDALLEVIHDRLMSNVTSVCAETAHPIERLHKLLEQHIQLIKENQGIPRLIFFEDIYGDRSDRKKKVYETIKKYLAKISDIVVQGQQEGLIRQDLDVGTVAMMFLGMIQPAAIIWYLGEGDFALARHARKAWELFYVSIKGGDEGVSLKKSAVQHGKKKGSER